VLLTHDLEELRVGAAPQHAGEHLRCVGGLAAGPNRATVAKHQLPLCDILLLHDAARSRAGGPNGDGARRLCYGRGPRPEQVRAHGAQSLLQGEVPDEEDVDGRSPDQPRVQPSKRLRTRAVQIFGAALDVESKRLFGTQSRDAPPQRVAGLVIAQRLERALVVDALGVDDRRVERRGVGRVALRTSDHVA